MIYDDGTMDVVIDGKPARVPFVIRSGGVANGWLNPQPVLNTVSRELMDFTCIGDDGPRFVTIREY